MICIGVFGSKKSFQTLDILMRLYNKNGINAVVGTIEDYHFFYNKYKGDFKESQISVFVVAIKNGSEFSDVISKAEFDIVVFLDGENNMAGTQKSTNRNVLVANCDEKSIFPFCVGIGTTLITCGINNKATITASSMVVSEEEVSIQCCIQRGIKTFSGVEIPPSEFHFSFPCKFNISYVLTILAVALISDITIGD